MGKPPFLKNGSCHRGYGAGGLRTLAALSVLKKPPLERFGVGIVLNSAFKDLAFDREPYGVGGLVALAASPAALGRFERGEQSPANLRGPNHRLAQVLQDSILSLKLGLFTILMSNEYPAPSGRR